MRRFSRSAKWPVAFLVIALAVAPLPTPAAGDALEAVRENFVSFQTGTGADPSDPRWQISVGALEAEARRFMAPGFLRSDGSWSDIDYAAIPSGGWSPWDHVRRLAVMARAYRTPGHALYRDPVLRASIEAAVAFVPTFYPATGDTPGNWWFWRIGIPLDLAPTLVLMQGEISDEAFGSALRSLSARIGPSPWYYPPATGLKGQNLAWSSFTHLCLALITNNESMLRASRDAMASVSRQVESGEGIQRDFSFHQHGAQLYTGGYGSSFAYEIGRFALITQGTSFALPDANLRTAADFIMEGIAWGLHHNYFDVSIIGREVSKPWANGYNGLAALLQMSEIESDRQAEIRRATAAMLETWEYTLPTELAAVASRFDGTHADWPAGNRHYFESDYTAHRRASFFSSIRMFSSRTKSGERTNGESVKGSRQSDGRFHLALAGDEYFGRDVWPTLDWSRLPGTTVEQKPDAANDQYGTGTRSFVGGVSDGVHGVSAMDLAPTGSDLRARKAWMFLDDAIVFMTSGVTLLNGNRAETILNQWPLHEANSPIHVNGGLASRSAPWARTLDGVSWVTAGDVGYHFPEPASLSIAREHRTGSWTSLGNAAPDPTPHTREIVTLWIDHGSFVSGGSTAYVVIPNADDARMTSWVAASPVRILRNDVQVSAARDERNGHTGIVFWAPASVEGVSANRASIVQIKRAGHRLTLNVSDPTHMSTSIRITLPGSWSLAPGETGVSIVSAGRSSTLEIPVSGGRTRSVALEDSSRRRGVVREVAAPFTGTAIPLR